MGLFGGDSSSETTQKQVGSQTQLGNSASGIKSTQAITSNAPALSLYKSKNNSISVTQSDYGAIEGGLNLASKVLDVNDSVLSVAQDFALDTIASAEKISSEIIEAGQYSAGATERIAGAFEAFVDDQNNPNEKNQMLLIVGVVGVLAVLIAVKK